MPNGQRRRRGQGQERSLPRRVRPATNSFRLTTMSSNSHRQVISPSNITSPIPTIPSRTTRCPMIRIIGLSQPCTPPKSRKTHQTPTVNPSSRCLRACMDIRPWRHSRCVFPQSDIVGHSRQLFGLIAEASSSIIKRDTADVRLDVPGQPQIPRPFGRPGSISSLPKT